MNAFKQRLLNVARSVRESPDLSNFTMERVLHACGMPACAWGHYIMRSDLQDVFIVVTSGAYCGNVFIRGSPKKENVGYLGPRSIEHFGLSIGELYGLFAPSGCGNAQKNPQKAIAYIEAFAERKWPALADRSHDIE